MDQEKVKDLSESIHYGFSAQDVQKIFPELVCKQGDNLSINYVEMIPLLLQEIQYLSKEVQGLKAQIIELKAK